MKQNIFVGAIKYIAIEILWDIVYFPIWWYSKGLARVGRYCLNSANFHLHRKLALGLWFRSMFKPMYGDYTKEGRIISFFMRIVVLVWKLLSVFVWFIILLIIFIAWVILPALVIYYILYQLFEVPFFLFK